MSFRQVDYMNIIAHAGAVRCVIVIAEDMKFLELSDRDLRNIRHQVVRDTVRILTHGS